ncbi:MAG: DUF5320 domain-containing protein [Sedimentisphaerales bacterium]|nr:DUF5320 domain-containing protein [Sedimentisphaerales bacterium]
MPRGDGTGPAGMGPMTGRAAGYCAGYSVPGFANNAVGGRGFFGRGRGGGGGFGRRNQFYATGLTGWQRFGAGAPFYGAAPFPTPAAPTKDQQLDALKAQAQYFNDALDDIKQRIADLEAESKK